MLAFELPHAEFVVAGIVFFILGVALLGLAQLLPRRPAPARDVPPAADAEAPVTVSVRTITWPALIDDGAGELSDAERLGVIDALGLVGDPWCARILVRAFEEEDGDVRVAAIDALARCDDGVVDDVLERAYRSPVVAERFAAIDGAARRGSVMPLERALRDTEVTVALAAAYGLHRVHRDDVVDRAIAERDDVRANEIRRVMPMLYRVAIPLD